MTYTVKKTSQFKKSYKLAVKRGLDVPLLENVIFNPIGYLFI